MSPMSPATAATAASAGSAQYPNPAIPIALAVNTAVSTCCGRAPRAYDAPKPSFFAGRINRRAAALARVSAKAAGTTSSADVALIAPIAATRTTTLRTIASMPYVPCVGSRMMRSRSSGVFPPKNASAVSANPSS